MQNAQKVFQTRGLLMRNKAQSSDEKTDQIPHHHIYHHSLIIFVRRIIIGVMMPLTLLIPLHNAHLFCASEP